MLLSIFTLSVFPHSADGLLPTAHAHTDDESVMLHDPSLALLDAATNIDPHPDKGADNIILTGNSALMANVGASSEMLELHDHDVVGARETVTVPEETGGEISEYTVKEGDTLSEIAEAHNVSTKTILWANDLANANSIRPGDTLVILPVSGIQYTIKSGDTLSALSKRYDVDASEILSYNNLDDEATLVIGKSILIPGGELQAASKSVASGSSKFSGGSSSGKTTSFSSSYFSNPLPNGKLSQSTHGYNAADLAAPAGSPIYASADGIIMISKDGWNGGYGNYIVVKHDNGTQTLYAHMTSRAIDSGTVTAGDVIGYVGSTGKSTGNHLHFEVRGGKNPFSS